MTIINDEPTFDTNGYPTADTLRYIEDRPILSRSSLSDLFDFIQRAWNSYGKCSVLSDGETQEIVFITGGWPGNESLIESLMLNKEAWNTAWYQSTRGGKYMFVF